MALSALHIPFSVTLTNEQESYDITETSVHEVSCYTTDLGAVTVTLSAFAANVPSYMSNNTVVWDMGDGTVLTSLTSSHVYQRPGEYKVSLVMYSSAGNAVSSTAVQEITAYDLIDNYIKLDSEMPVFVCDIPAAQSVTDASGINLIRYNSWQNFAAVSANGYSFVPHASGAVSKKRNNSTAANSKWAHLEKTWNFFNVVTANNGSKILTSVDSISTTCTSLYFRVCSFTDGFGDAQKAIVPTTSAHEDAVFVGTSGTAVLYFRESQPKNYTSDTQPIILFVSQDNFSTNQGESTRIAVPVKSRYNHAAGIKLTSSGINNDNFDISNFKYAGTKVPVFVSLLGTDGGITLNYPALSANVGVTSVDTDSVVNLSLVKTDGTHLSAEWFETFDDQLPSKISGTFRGYFIPKETSDGVTLSAQVRLTDPVHFGKDSVYNCYAANNSKQLYRWTLGDRYDSAGAKTSVIHLSSHERTDTIDYFGVAMVPVSANAYHNQDFTLWVPSSASQRIYLHNTHLHGVSSVDMTLLPITLEGQDEYAIAIGTSQPLYAGANSEGNVWVTLHNSLSTVKFNKGTGKVVAFAAPDNRDINATTTAPTNPGFNAGDWYGQQHHKLQPCQVACDTNDDMWVTYGSPVCAFCEKYSTDGSALSAKFEFPDNLVPHDILINNDDDIYIAAGFSDNGIRPLFVPLSATVTPALSTDLYAFDLTNITETSAANWLSAAGTNHVVVISGMSTGYLNGTYEIDSVVNTGGTNYRIAVRPNICSLVSAASSTVAARGAAVHVMESDVVYKVNSTGTLITTFSGFLHPSFLAIDPRKSIGVGHNWYSLTEISSADAVGSTLYSVTSATLKDHLGDFTGATPGQHITGVAGDLGGNFYVLNGLENKMYVQNFIDSTTASHNLSSGINSLSTRAWGDWNASQYMHKYTNSSGTFHLTAALTLDVLPASGKYHMYRFNEDFDPQETFKSYRYQEFLLNDTRYFDDFFGTIMGTASSNPNLFGKKVYEKVSNFTGNVVDLDTCNISQVYSMAEMLNIPITDYDFNYPSNLRRVVDLTSVAKSNIFGHRSQYERDFDDRRTLNPDFATNLGTEMLVTTASLTAGQKIVARQLFDDQYRMITCSYVSAGSVYEDNIHYVTIGSTKAGLSSYPLSAFSRDWNWNLDAIIDGAGIADYYKFYEHVDAPSAVQVEGQIDWANTYNTVDEDTTTEDWFKDDGIVDGLIDYEFRQGLSMFQTVTGGTMSAVRFDYHPYWHVYDQLAPLSGAYGTRVLITDYVGPLLTVTETGTWSSSSFQPVDGELNMAQVSSFCHPNSGLVSTWFDQSSAQNNLTQTVCAEMPIIYRGVSATVMDSNGDPALEFTTGRYLSSTTGGAYSHGVGETTPVRSQTLLFRGEFDGSSDTVYRELNSVGNPVVRVVVDSSTTKFEVLYTTNAANTATLQSIDGGSITADTLEKHQFEIDNTENIGQFTYRNGTVAVSNTANSILFDYDLPGNVYSRGNVYLGGSNFHKPGYTDFNGTVTEFAIMAGNIRDDYLSITSYK